ncbi:MAG: putative tricarboxylic transport rane protein [Archaeoglobi archaeon]|nr:putative tricarboxylic transport rane protein [Archaeoglobi archaeon]
MDAFAMLQNPMVIAAIILAQLFGVFIGLTPGLTATLAVALLVPFSYFMDPLTGIGMIIALEAVAIFAGDIPAVLFRIPGTPSSAAQTIDAYLLGRKKSPSEVLYVDLIFSTLGGIIGSLILIFAASIIAEFASKFSTIEYFWLVVWGLSMAIIISSDDPKKGLIGVLIGFLATTIGVDYVYGFPRFTFGIIEFQKGISFIPAMIGLFAIPELVNLSKVVLEKKYIMEPRGEMRKTSFSLIKESIRNYKSVFARSSVIGTFIGALPGAGADVAAWIAYGLGKRLSKKPEEYGKGSLEGVVAATSANNAGLGGAWIPALVFGIPGDSITAIAIGALMAHGLRPGPLLFQENRVLITALFITFIIANIFLIFIGYFAIRASTKFLKVPRNILIPLIFIFCVIGAYSVNNSLFDVWVMFIFGIIGIFLSKWGVPLQTVVLAIILGPMIEYNFTTSLMKSGMNIGVFFSRPLAIVLSIMVILSWILPFILGKMRWRSD